MAIGSVVTVTRRLLPVVAPAVGVIVSRIESRQKKSGCTAVWNPLGTRKAGWLHPNAASERSSRRVASAEVVSKWKTTMVLTRLPTPPRTVADGGATIDAGHPGGGAAT